MITAAIWMCGVVLAVSVIATVFDMCETRHGAWAGTVWADKRGYLVMVDRYDHALETVAFYWMFSDGRLGKKRHVMPHREFVETFTQEQED